MENSKAHKMPMDVATLRKAFRERMKKRIAEGLFMHNAEVHCMDGSITLIEMPNMRSEIQRLIIRTRPMEDAILVFHASELCCPAPGRMERTHSPSSAPWIPALLEGRPESDSEARPRQLTEFLQFSRPQSTP